MAGVFGKLPDRRDFVEQGMAPGVMARLDPWLGAAMQALRERPDWRALFLTAPILRFWWGREIAGVAVLGALMPSVDGVGRYFPLVVAETGAPPPERSAQAAWFAAAEALLLAALVEGGTWAALQTGLSALPAPADPAPDASGFDGLRQRHAQDLYARHSLWWQDPAGEAAYLREGLPPPQDYANMIAERSALGGARTLGER